MSGQIYELLSDRTRQMLDEQIGWLRDSDNPKFRNLLVGAETVLDILKTDPAFESGTSNWLKAMNVRQLEYAIKAANKILKEKKSKGKISVYGVHSGVVDDKYFFGRKEANEYFVKIAVLAVKEDLCPELSICKHRIDVDELGDYGLEEVQESAGSEN